MDLAEIEAIRREFPILGREIAGRRMVYLDNSATSQTPDCVVLVFTPTKRRTYTGVSILCRRR